MKLYPFKESTHSGNRSWLGTNPNIEIVDLPEKADFIWLCQWGDGQAIRNDMEACRKLGKCIFNITGDECYVPGEDDGHFYFVTHLNPNSRCHQTQVPYSYHASIDWRKANLNRTGTKELLANFQGSFDTNHDRRKLKSLENKHIFIKDCDGWKAAQSGNWEVIREHDELLFRSYFTLCPRGIGKTSIRVVEAIFRESIPVLIDDDTKLFGCPMIFALNSSYDNLHLLYDRMLRIIDEPREWESRREKMHEFKSLYLLADEAAGCEGTIGYSELIRLILTT